MLINSVKACRVILVSMECEYTSEKQYTDRQTDGRNEHDKQTTIKHYEHTFSVCWRGFQNMTTRRPNSGRRVVFVPKGACLRLCLLNVIITINNTPDNVEVHTHTVYDSTHGGVTSGVRCISSLELHLYCLKYDVICPVNNSAMAFTTSQSAGRRQAETKL